MDVNRPQDLAIRFESFANLNASFDRLDASIDRLEKRVNELYEAVMKEGGAIIEFQTALNELENKWKDLGSKKLTVCERWTLEFFKIMMCISAKFQEIKNHLYKKEDLWRR